VERLNREIRKDKKINKRIGILKDTLAKSQE
jgi:hypothetical protein